VPTLLARFGVIAQEFSESAVVFARLTLEVELLAGVLLEFVDAVFGVLDEHDHLEYHVADYSERDQEQYTECRDPKVQYFELFYELS
jgi:hypothetical protein